MRAELVSQQGDSDSDGDGDGASKVAGR